MVNIYVLNDDRCYNSKFTNNHGLSLFIENDDFCFLFDVGQECHFINNAKMLDLDLSKVQCLVLSHGHYDHTNALVNVDSGLKIVCHPSCMVWRKSNRTGNYNGMPISEEEFKNKFNVIFSAKPYEISENVIFLGEIERKMDFECKKFPSTFKDGSVDTAPDDSGVAIKTYKGLIVITGCGHSGICNTVNYAKKVCECEDVYAVIGGFHLKNIDEQADKTIEFMKQNKVKNIIMGHCTSDEVCEYFKVKLKNSIDVGMLSTGKIIAL